MISAGRRSIACRLRSHQLSRSFQRGFLASRSSDDTSTIRFLSNNDSTVGTSTSLSADDGGNTTCIYLHVGPSGDFWTGHSIFAAKHLQPDYVKSVKLDEKIDVDALLDLLEENGDEWAQAIYDEGKFPQVLLDRLNKASKD